MGDAGGEQFRNLEPRTREERLAAKSKDLLEKQRIDARSTRPGKQQGTVANPVVPVKASPMYIDEYDRFNRDVAGDLQRQQKQEHQKKEDCYSQKRAEAYYKDKERWEREQAKSDKTEQRYQAARDSGAGARRNKSSEEYNILTLNYNATPNGQALAQKDEAVKHKAELRSQHLYSKSHSVTHNIITGEPLRMPAPAAPRAASTGPVAPWDK